ncbi:MAG: HlyD family efflux transporter periplasmic adaptor subunit [Myxococcales bacterium]|nr:HlyD family efflux transporter periplasmic adaptor subunit [Myxococcales bacterium]
MTGAVHQVDGGGEGEVARKAARERRRLLQSWIKRFLGMCVVLAAGGAIALSFMPKPIAVDLAKVERASMQVSIDEDGRTRVKDRYVLSAPLLANLARIELRPGDSVVPDKVLARLLPLTPSLLDPRSRAQAQAKVAAATAARRQAHASVQRMRTAAEFATREAERQRGLLGSGAASERTAEHAELEARSRSEELASADFGAKVADYELQMARAALGRMGARGESEQFEIGSPVVGRVLKVLHKDEGVVQPGTPLLEIGDPAALEIVVDVLTADAVHIEPGSRVLIERWGGERALSAHVRLVEPSAFTRVSALGVEEQRVNVIVDLDEDHAHWSQLGDGYRVEARIIIWQGQDLLTAPASAVFRRGEGYAAFVEAQGKATLVAVEVGKKNAQRVEVLGGLKDGQRVILHPSDRIVDGVLIEAR